MYAEMNGASEFRFGICVYVYMCIYKVCKGKGKDEGKDQDKDKDEDKGKDRCI